VIETCLGMQIPSRLIPGVNRVGFQRGLYLVNMVVIEQESIIYLGQRQMGEEVGGDLLRRVY